MAKSLQTGNIFPNPEIDASDLGRILADGNIGDVLTQTGVGTVAMQAPDPGYLEYVALLTQTGTDAPASTVMVNTLSGTPVIARSASGSYSVTLANAFVSGKTTVEYSGDLNLFPLDDLAGAPLPLVRCRRNTASVIGIYTALYDRVAGTCVLSDDILQNFVLRVRVYP